MVSALHTIDNSPEWELVLIPHTQLIPQTIQPLTNKKKNATEDKPRLIRCMNVYERLLLHLLSLGILEFSLLIITNVKYYFFEQKCL